MAKIVLTLHNYRMEALERAMEAEGGVERYMQDLLIDLFSERVPFEKQVRIQKQIAAERQKQVEGQDRDAEAHITDSVTQGIRYIPGAHPLRPENIVFRDDVLRHDDLLNFKFDPYEICEALGVPDDINVPGGLINAYINYNLAARKPDADLDVVLSTEDECGEESVLYHLSEAEAAMLLPRMDAYCKSTRGRGLEEIAQSYAVNRDLEREKKSSHAAINPRKKPPEKRPEKRPER